MSDPENAIDRFEGWRVLPNSSNGAMGIVYRVESLNPPNRRGAAKVLRPGLNSAELRRRFERERLILERVTGPNSPAVLDHGLTHTGLPFFVMQWIDGPSLDRFFAEQTPPPRTAAALLADLADAVHALHERGIAHGDLKPDNVLIDANAPAPARPVLIDFGVARVFAPVEDAERLALPSDFGSQILTPAFASPEQRAGQPPIPASDIYTLGLIVRLLAPAALLADPNAPLPAFLARAAAVEPDQRPSSAAELAALLRTAAT